MWHLIPPPEAVAKKCHSTNKTYTIYEVKPTELVSYGLEKSLMVFPPMFLFLLLLPQLETKLGVNGLKYFTLPN